MNLISSLEGHTDWLTAVRLGKDAKYILTGARDGRAILFDKLGDIVTEYKGGHVKISTVLFTPDENRVMTIDVEGVIRVYSKLLGIFI